MQLQKSQPQGDRPWCPIDGDHRTHQHGNYFRFTNCNDQRKDPVPRFLCKVCGHKINEIPVACQLFEKLDLQGRPVSLDALYTQDETARDLVLEHGADYLLTVMDNQATVHRNIELLLEPPGRFCPLGSPRRPKPAPRK